MADTEFTPIDVGLLILDAVAVLHTRGHQLLRILPGMSSSGTHWRINVTASANMTDADDRVDIRDWDTTFNYSSAGGFEIAGTQVFSTTTPESIADLILAALTDRGTGTDLEYVEWFAQLLAEAHRYRAVPLAYGDYFDAAAGWEIGWSSGVRIPRPPLVGVSTHAFSSHVAVQVGWYVYALRNPLDSRVFYVGKGRGNRVFAHAEQAQASSDEDLLSQKLDLINSIHASGKRVEAFVIRHGLSTEELAYDVEASVIDVLRLLDPDLDNELFGLTNIVMGHNTSTRGLARVDVIASLYDAPAAPAITDPALLIKIPGLWTPTMSAFDLYEATRQWWRLGDRRNKASYAFAVNHGVVRAVYQIDSWEPGWFVNDMWSTGPHDSPPHRWRFIGRVDEVLLTRYRNTSVKHLYKPGEAYPVRYFNC